MTVISISFPITLHVSMLFFVTVFWLICEWDDKPSVTQTVSVTPSCLTESLPQYKTLSAVTLVTLSADSWTYIWT